MSDLPQIDAVLKLNKTDIILLDAEIWSREDANRLLEQLRKVNIDNLMLLLPKPLQSMTIIEKSKLLEELNK